MDKNSLEYPWDKVDWKKDATEEIINLINAGADINAKGGYKNRTALMRIVEEASDSCTEEEIEALRENLMTLIRKGADVKVKDDDDNTAFFLSIKSGRAVLAGIGDILLAPETAASPNCAKIMRDERRERLKRHRNEDMSFEREIMTDSLRAQRALDASEIRKEKDHKERRRMADRLRDARIDSALALSALKNGRG